jgi:hypothetical protein
MDRVIERAAQVAQAGEAAKHTYQKQSTFEELDAGGAAIRSTQKTYQVVLIGGWPFSRLVKVQGLDLSPAQLQREDEREQRFRNKLAGRDLGKAAQDKQPLVLPDLVARYNFTVLSNEVCQTRNTVVLQFTPKPTNPENTLQDRIYNRLAGRIWVDEQEAEVAKLDVHLTEEFSLGWVGLLGSLTRCDLNMERKRLPDGTWVNAKNIMLILGRKLLTPKRFRTIEVSSDFQAASPNALIPP